MAQNEFTRDPRLRSREDGAASGSSSSEKNTSTTYPSNKVKNSPRPHPYAIYGRTKDGRPQYDYVVNTGDENRGTAVIYRCGLTVDAIEKHPSGRVIAMKINNIQVLNVYLPSGTNHRQQRESFLSKELPFFLRHRYDCLLIGGDWNCVLHAKDQTGQYNPSPVLANLTQDLHLVDTWELLHGNRVEYTFRRQNGASRLDRFYITRTHSKCIYRIQVFPTPFSDHDCVLLSLQTDITLPIYGKGSWKLNNTLLHIPEISEQFSQHFEKLISKANKSKLNIMQKWVNIIKPGIKTYFQQAGIIRAEANRDTLNFYYQLLNELYAVQQAGGNKWQEILNIKSTICALQQKFMDGVKIRARTPTVSEDERCALYHLVKEKRNARTKYISHLQTTEGTQLTSNSDCIKEIETFFRALYSASPTSATETDTLLKHVNRHLNLQQQHDLQLPITEEEILRAIETAPKNSAPGPDGLTYQLYKMQWNLIKDTLVDLFNYIFDRGIVVEGFSDGIVILLPKVTNPRTVSEYRPITLLNTDYKLFMKILACRVKTTFRDIIEIGQTCSVPDKSIIHNLATIRDSILYYEEFPDEKAALLSIDFNKAFDRMNHLYLQRVMKHFCIPEKFVNAISSLYDSAYSKIQVNGFFTKRIPIASSVRQGCPLSMCLFAIGIEPLIRMSHNILQAGRATCNMFTIRAYADDVVILLRDEDECTKLPQILHTYSMASCAQINVQKSSLLPLGNWAATHTVNHIPIKRKAKILGLTVCASFKEMVDINWSITSARTRATMFQHIHRNLNLLERIWHINVFCLSKLWYLAQILPLPSKYSTVLDRAISFYVWKGYFYKLPKTQLHLPITKGGLQLTAIKEKSQALLTRNILRAKHDESDPMDNKFWQDHIPLLCSKTTTLPHSLKMIWEIIESYPPTTVTNEKNQNTKTIYTYLMKKAVQTPRIVEKLPNQKWGNIWRNLHMANIPTAWKTTVYCYLNQIIPTEEKRHRHNLTDSPACKKCGWLDTLKHRVTNCGAAKTIWEGAKALLVKVWPDSQLHDWFQTLLVLDPPTKQNKFVTVWLASGFLHYQLTKSLHKMEEFLHMLKEEAAKLEMKDDKSSQILKELKLLQLNSSLNLV
ncbi:hypothetical protein ANN_17726 [Periplaneta americana]|uniref:Reverse transcriptase domain-containing protein n=1 Tax=Periplaneta americana TaxID=6978 RepID=A0ABQ8SV26_PERAM|nr:hypothetical protein ANN_17726 [Periplaneta americana]